MSKIPQGQKRLTNIAIVRLKVHGLKFEVAWCVSATQSALAPAHRIVRLRDGRSYKNTVVSWRNQMCALRGLPAAVLRAALRREKNLDNVLQSTTVYANVSKARTERLPLACRLSARLPLTERPRLTSRLLSQGVLANKEDLQTVFGTKDEARVCVLVRR